MVLAQEVPPAADPAQPTTTTTTTAAPETAPTAPDTSTTADTSSATTTVARHSTKTVASRSKPVSHTTVTKKATTSHTTAPVAAPVAAATPVATTTKVTQTSQSAVKPIVDTTAPPAAARAPQAVQQPARSNGNGTAIELGAGALALLAVGAGAYALTRRRREEDELINETYEHAPADHREVVQEEPAMIAPEVSAFAWGNRSHIDARTNADADRRPGESWVDRAYRGPCADNPSQSLRKRLKRAAFFDKRDREVAAGMAAPVETDAGLPENRELEAA